MLSDGNGTDVLDFLDRQDYKLPCVVVSAGSQKQLDELDRSNIVARPRKPFDIADFISALQRCVG